jgi:hypothetical protein
MAGTFSRTHESFADSFGIANFRSGGRGGCRKYDAMVGVITAAAIAARIGTMTCVRRSRQRLPFDQLHHERERAGRFLDAVDVRDVRVVERRQHLRLSVESVEPLGIRREQLRQHLDRDVAIQPRIARAIDLAHAAGAEGGNDLVRTEAAAGTQRHGGYRSDGPQLRST